MSADGEDGAAEAAKPKFTIDVAAAGGQKTSTLAAEEFELSSADALAVVCVCQCCCSAPPRNTGRVGGSDEYATRVPKMVEKKACSMLFRTEHEPVSIFCFQLPSA